MPHGKTLLMRNIRKPAPQWVHKHTHKAARDRRHDRDRTTGAVRNWPRDLRAPAMNTPYRNPLRDLKPKRFRRLRIERKIELVTRLAKIKVERDA